MAKIIISLSKEEYEKKKRSCIRAFSETPTKEEIDNQIIENIMCDWYDVENIGLEVNET